MYTYGNRARFQSIYTNLYNKYSDHIGSYLKRKHNVKLSDIQYKLWLE